jgi:hypothetical protein
MKIHRHMQMQDEKQAIPKEPFQITINLKSTKFRKKHRKPRRNPEEKKELITGTTLAVTPAQVHHAYDMIRFSPKRSLQKKRNY